MRTYIRTYIHTYIHAYIHTGAFRRSTRRRFMNINIDSTNQIKTIIILKAEESKTRPRFGNDEGLRLKLDTKSSIGVL